MTVFIATISNKHLDFLDMGSTENKIRFREFCKKNEGKQLRIELVKDKSQRTPPQNNALHKWYELVANELNEAGYTVQIVLKEKIDLDWDSTKVKELLWRPAQQAILGKKSTTELKKIEDIDKVWEHLNRHLGSKFGIHVEFPHNEEQIGRNYVL